MRSSLLVVPIVVCAVFVTPAVHAKSFEGVDVDFAADSEHVIEMGEGQKAKQLTDSKSGVDVLCMRTGDGKFRSLPAPLPSLLVGIAETQELRVTGAPEQLGPRLVRQGAEGPEGKANVFVLFHDGFFFSFIVSGARAQPAALADSAARLQRGLLPLGARPLAPAATFASAVGIELPALKSVPVDVQELGGGVVVALAVIDAKDQLVLSVRRVPPASPRYTAKTWAAEMAREGNTERAEPASVLGGAGFRAFAKMQLKGKERGAWLFRVDDDKAGFVISVVGQSLDADAALRTAERLLQGARRL